MSMSYPCQVIAKDLGCSQIYSNMGLSENRIPFSHRVPSQNAIVGYRWWCNYLIKPPPLKKYCPLNPILYRENPLLKHTQMDPDISMFAGFGQRHSWIVTPEVCNMTAALSCTCSRIGRSCARHFGEDIL